MTALADLVCFIVNVFFQLNLFFIDIEQKSFRIGVGERVQVDNKDIILMVKCLDFRVCDAGCLFQYESYDLVILYDT